MTDTAKPSDKNVINELKPIADIVMKSRWEVCPQCDSKNTNIISERFTDGKTTYVISYNTSDMKRVTFLILYEYEGPNTIKNLAENSDYNIKNKTIDIMYYAKGMSAFSY